MKLVEDFVNVSHGIGIPFGGIGTGYALFGKYGFIRNNFNSVPDVPMYKSMNEKAYYDYENNLAYNTFMAITVTENDEKFVLQEKNCDWIEGKRADKFESYAYLPFGLHRMSFEKAEFETEILMFSPMIPHNLRGSSIPVLCMELCIKNNMDKDRTFQINFELNSAENLYNECGSVDFKFENEGKLCISGNGKEKLKLFFSWYYPEFQTPSKSMTDKFMRYYTLQFNNTKEILDYACIKADMWKDEINKWHNSLEIACQFKRLWFSSLSSVITSTMLSTDEVFIEIETPHSFVNTMDVCVYSSWVYLINWPEIEKMDIRMYNNSIQKEGEDKGFVWHSLWNDRSNYVEEPTYITRIYRDYLWFNDRKFLEDVFDSMKIAFERVYEQSYDGLIESKRGNQSYDVWKMPGVSAYINSAWIFSLYSLNKISKILGEEIIVKNTDIEEILRHAIESFEKYLWNGKYYNCFYRTPEASELSEPDSVFTDHLFGRWVLGIDSNAQNVLPEAKMKKSIEYVYLNNVVDDKQNNFKGWANGVLDNKIPYCDNKQYHAKTCWLGAQLNLASLLGLFGNENASIDVFDSIEKSLSNNHLSVGEWNKCITEEGKSSVLEIEPSKDTPRFPSYPRYKSAWEYLVRIIGLRINGNSIELKPFKIMDFKFKEIILAGCKMSITVKKNWSQIYVDGQEMEKALFDRNSCHNLEFI